MESQSAVSHVKQDTNTKASATTLGRIPVVDPQPYSPCSLTFKAQNSETDVAETAVFVHGITTLTYRSRCISSKRVSRGGPNSDCGEKLGSS